MRNIRLTIEYDGTDFVGWQRQAVGRSVQEVIEAALGQITQAPVDVVGAGRTDAGVHAHGQVANFKTDFRFGPDEFMRSLNAMFPPDIVIRAADEVPLQFSARYSATERWYRYFISRIPTALRSRYTWPLYYDLDIDTMNQAVQVVKAAPDFASFCKSDSDVTHYRCVVNEAVWSQNIDGSAITFSIRANRFLRGMVRALVGTMVDVGRGFISLEQLREVIEARDRSRAGMSAPAQGLFLEGVRYD
jgi:tRNA pseudouridine38-40 synthase